MKGNIHSRLLIIACIIVVRVRAQDPHFTQYFASPLTLNPAITGNFDGPLRLAANFRNQWWATGSAFNTVSLSFEHRLLTDKLDENDRLGVGGMMMADNSLSGGLRSTYMSLSASFHKALSDRHRLGLGFQSTYGNRVVDLSRLSFSNQFDTDGFDTGLPSGEAALMAIKPMISVATGMMYTYEDDQKRLYAGFSLYHLNRPRQTANDDSLNRMAMRYTMHAGAVILSGESLRFTVHGLWQSQGKATETSVGAALGYDLDGQNTLYAGTWYRWKDAFCPYLSYIRKGMQVAFSFDIPVSVMRQVVRRNGSMEISFIFTKPDIGFEKRVMPWNY
jgi:type IX secretion system PorP/SprF family membrane protein